MADKDAAAAERIDLDRLTVPQLRALIAETETRLRQKQEAAKAELLAKWKAEAEENGLSLHALLPGNLPKAPKGSRKASGESLPASTEGRMARNGAGEVAYRSGFRRKKLKVGTAKNFD